MTSSAEVKETSGKGFGLVATQPIEPGTCILEEVPLLVLHDAPDVWAWCLESVFIALSWRAFQGTGIVGWVLWAALSLLAIKLAPICCHYCHLLNSIRILPTSQKELFFRLHSGTPSSWPLLRSINIVRLNVLPADDVSVICATICRVNHSCDPNAWAEWDAEKAREVLHARRHIDEGEEITITYCNMLQTRAARQCDLQSKYGFICTCIACSAPDGEGRLSDSRRLQCQDLEDRAIPLNMQESNFAEALRDIELLLDTIDAEFGKDCHNGKGKLCWQASVAARKMGDEKLAETWITKSHLHQGFP